MKEFLIKALLQPFVAILFCLAFGLPFVYVGFQTVYVEGTKDEQGMVTIDFTCRLQPRACGLSAIARGVRTSPTSPSTISESFGII